MQTVDTLHLACNVKEQFPTFLDQGKNRMDNRFRNFGATIKRKERGGGSVPRLFTARSKKGGCLNELQCAAANWQTDQPLVGQYQMGGGGEGAKRECKRFSRICILVVEFHQS